MELTETLKDLAPSTILVIALFFMARNQSKVLPQAMATTSQVVTGIEGLRADLRDDRQTLSNHNEQSIQRQAVVLQTFEQGFRSVKEAFDETCASLREMVKELAEIRVSTDQAAASQTAIVSVLGEMKKTMETNSTQEITTQAKLDRILALLEEMKKEWQQTTSQFKARLESVEADVQAVKIENGKPPENKPTINEQENN